MPALTVDFIKSAINNQHLNYAKTVQLANKLRVHADGIVPTDLIDKRRPSEPEAIKDYRKLIYVPKTKNPIQKVINSLSKIRRSQDWNIHHVSDYPSQIAKEETLREYCEENYPGYSSITNWCFSDLLKQYLIDANSVVAIFPKSLPTDATQYLKPEIEIFGSDQVIDYNEEEKYCVLRSADKTIYKTPQGLRTYQGNIYYIITETQVVRYSQVHQSAGGYTLDFEYNHNIGKMPAFRVGGVFLQRVNNQTIFDSRISAMVPNLDEAAREYSDLQAEIVQHIHSEKYAYTNTECPICKGTGTVKDPNFPEDKTKNIRCANCGGLGSVQGISPYGVHLISAASVGEHQLPTPPLGYISKDVEIAKLQDQRVQNHIYGALASLNMEFLAQSPLNQSGTAKEVDKDELNNFVNSIAEDIVRILDNVYFFINELRYALIVPDKDKRRAMLPSIAVPEKFDLLNSQYLMNEVKLAKEAGVSPSVMKHLQVDYARKKFNSDADTASEVEAVFELDPLFGLTNDEKLAMLAVNGITMKDYVISCNINQFVTRAVEENENNFFKLSYKEKRAQVSIFAEEIIKENSTKEQIKKSLDGPVK